MSETNKNLAFSSNNLQTYIYNLASYLKIETSKNIKKSKSKI